jgi:hypothetical protein
LSYKCTPFGKVKFISISIRAQPKINQLNDILICVHRNLIFILLLLCRLGFIYVVVVFLLLIDVHVSVLQLDVATMQAGVNALCMRMQYGS